MTSVQEIILNDGSKIPAIGLGVYRSAPGEETYSAVLNALKGEYRHIDTAQISGMKEMLVKRLKLQNCPEVRSLSLPSFGLEVGATKPPEIQSIKA
eukprot:CAMPEP_0119036346 /NCGR_PEP_ID=MMETSP1177-20130426/4024_1 /TAXON_ID=2985 /ORGANISM="Ochromonas sp, Strain CCMP1899" /LENGTH=95 /DNA_ID=CAMNT_0006996105 /DNA_START=100 /DNA_END=388 /DNA_ORIENTATION=-